MLKQLSFLLFAFVLVSCNGNSAKQEFSQVNYYHWGQDFTMENGESDILKYSNSKRLYTRFFDVQWDEWGFKAPVPESVIAFKNKSEDIEIVPTVYITNEVMEKLAEENKDTRDLARRVVKKIQNIADTTNINIREIQFDCDWNETSREKYFQFLEQAKGFVEEDVELSATIRLHQVKYADKTGVPPVDKGVLMVYNMGKVNDKEEVNSIFNRETTAQYLSGYKNYKLPLNLALPSFSWGVKIYDYTDRVGIVNNVIASDLENPIRFKKIDSNLYLVKKYGMVNGNYYSDGEMIRVEQPSIEDIQWAIDTFNKEIRLKPENPEIIFYEIESKFLKENYQNNVFK